MQTCKGLREFFFQLYKQNTVQYLIDNGKKLSLTDLYKDSLKLITVSVYWLVLECIIKEIEKQNIEWRKKRKNT